MKTMQIHRPYFWKKKMSQKKIATHIFFYLTLYLYCSLYFILIKYLWIEINYFKLDILPVYLDKFSLCEENVDVKCRLAGILNYIEKGPFYKHSVGCKDGQCLIQYNFIKNKPFERFICTVDPRNPQKIIKTKI